MGEVIYKRISIACTSRNLSRADYTLLCTAGYRLNVLPARFIRMAKAGSEGEPEPTPTVEELESALESLCERGILMILSAEDAEWEAQRRLDSRLTELCDENCEPGAVDFTPSGYQMFRELILEIFGAEHLAYNDSGFVFDESSKSFLVLAPTLELCLRRITEIKECPQSYTGSEVCCVVADVSEPVSIGLWMPNRFVQLERGFQSTIQMAEFR